MIRSRPWRAGGITPSPAAAHQPLTFEIIGPYRSENQETFRDFDLWVDAERLSAKGAAGGEPGASRLSAPAFFAADGRAAETGARAGSVWKAHFSLPEPGAWRASVRFRRGVDAAVARLANAAHGFADYDIVWRGDLEIGPGDRSEAAATDAVLSSEAPRRSDDDLTVQEWRGLLTGPEGALTEAAAASIADAVSKGRRPGPPVVGFDLFAAAPGDAAAGGAFWRRVGAVDPAAPSPQGPWVFDGARIARWRVFLSGLAARGLVIELNLDPPDPAAAQAFWADEAFRLARWTALRELAARLGGRPGIRWRGGLSPADRTALAEMLRLSGRASPDNSAPSPSLSREQATPLVPPAGQAAEASQEASQEPSQEEPPRSKPDGPELRLAALAAPRRLRVDALTAVQGDADLRIALYRLDPSAASPEAEPVPALDGLELTAFADSKASLIVRLTGADAPSAAQVSLWVRRIADHGASALPATEMQESEVVGPGPVREAADPFALFNDLAELGGAAKHDAAHVLQLVLDVEAAATGPADAPRRLLRWIAPIAHPKGLVAALGALPAPSARVAPEPDVSGAEAEDQPIAEPPATPQASADQTEGAGAAKETAAAPRASEQPERLSGGSSATLAPPLAPPQTLGEALLKKIDAAPQTEDPKAPEGPSPLSSASRETRSEQDATRPASDQSAAQRAQGNPEAEPPRRRRFTGVVSQARARASSQPPIEAAEGAAPSPEASARETLEADADRVPTPLIAAATGGSDKAPAPAEAISLLRDRMASGETAPPAATPTSAADGARPELALRRLELIDAETDRRIAAVRDGAVLPAAAVDGKRLTVKATLAGGAAEEIERVRLTLEIGPEDAGATAQRAVDRPQAQLGERVGHFYGVRLNAGDVAVLVEALASAPQTGDAAPLFSEWRRFRID